MSSKKTICQKQKTSREVKQVESGIIRAVEEGEKGAGVTGLEDLDARGERRHGEASVENF